MKKGFTLVELSVAMAVSAVAIAMLAVCFVAINTFFQKKELQTIYLNELTTFKTQFELALEDYQTNEFVLVENLNESNTITIQNGENSSTISFSDSILFHNSVALYEFKTIKNVNLTTKQNLINCTIEYGEDLTTTYVFAKRV